MNKDKLIDLAKANLESFQREWENKDEYLEKASTTTTNILDNLDKDLEQLENKALNTFNDVKNNLSSWFTSLNEPQIQFKYTKFISNGGFNARVITELQSLESNDALYIDQPKSNYILTDENKDEIIQFSNQNDLYLLNTLKSFNGDANAFWQLYFEKRKDIIEKDKARREVLKEKEKEEEEKNKNKNKNKNKEKKISGDEDHDDDDEDDEEEFNWDDDE